MRTIAALPSVLLFGCAALGCQPSAEERPRQRLVASGVVLGADGVTPLRGQTVERYNLTFTVNGEVGEAAIQRLYSEDAAGLPFTTDAAGRFEIRAEDLALSYDWKREELECVDVCATTETRCQQVTEEVCHDTCSEEQCWDECWDECSTECWDETVCDEYDCWIETVCQDNCSPVCEWVCEVVSYPCNCSLETYDDCEDVCVETVEECDWVTRSHTSYPALAEVVDTSAHITLRAATGASHVVLGDVMEAYPLTERHGNSTWIQKDRFVTSLPVE